MAFRCPAGDDTNLTVPFTLSDCRRGKLHPSTNTWYVVYEVCYFGLDGNRARAASHYHATEVRTGLMCKLVGAICLR